MQSYQIQVPKVIVMKGNVAVLQCNVPPFVRSLITVSTWLRDEPLLGRTALHPGGRYTLTTTGTLHIRDADLSDNHDVYYCQTVHRLTGERRLSEPGKIFVTEPEGNVPPRIEHAAPAVNARASTPADLVCAAQGYPPPSYKWYRELGGSLAELRPGTAGPVRAQQSVLRFARVAPEDAGRYVCVAANLLGEDRRELSLSVSTSLTAHIRPQQQVVDAGTSAVFNCSLQGGSAGGGAHVTWLKDGRPLLDGPRVSVLTGGHALLVRQVRKSDRGMYQCMARSGDESAQGSAELTLGAVAPELQSTFIEQTLQPGPPVSLRCTASGNPPPHVTWLLDGGGLLPRGYVLGSYMDSAGDVVSHLNISSVRVQHGGLYTCVARNMLGSAQHSATLNIYGPPSPRPPQNLTVVAGTDVVLRCPVAGFPIASVAWQRAGELLPNTLRQHLFANGSLQLRRVEGGADRGEYACAVRNQQGQQATGRLYLEIMKPPEIAPFQFPNNLQEGNRAQVSCSIISGDLPISISWRKDGSPLPREPDVHEQQHEFVSNLLFSDLAERHSGLYTCIASNAAAVANYTTKLIVRVAPSWMIEPQDASVLYQRPLALHCQASGFPSPSITWMKARGSQPTDFMPLENNPQVMLSSNGSVLIRAADPIHEGHYTCQASNGIGSGLSKVIFLRVNVPAHFASRAVNQSGIAGEDVMLTCEAKGDLPVHVTWSTIHRSLTPSQSQVTEEQTPSGLIAKLHLDNLSRRDAGPYHCSAMNEFGQDEMTIFLTVKEPPEKPSRVEVLETGSRWASVEWGVPYSGHAPISYYVVQFREESSGVWNNVTVGGAARTARIGTLKPATPYSLRLLAVNEVGAGEPSEPTAILTLQEAPSGPPIDVTVEATVPETLVVRWKPPLQSYSNGDILGYQIAYREDSANGPQPQQLRTVRGRHRLEVTLTNLRHYTRYEITVRAFNQVGAGPASIAQFVLTLEGVPDMPPQDLLCSAISPQSIRVRWSPPLPEHQNGHIEGYKVFYKSVNHNRVPSDIEVKKTTNLETNLHGLAKFSNYSVRVLAFTSAGEGARTQPIYCMTEEDIPGPPEQIKALAMTSDSIMVAWTRPTEPNGNIVKYNVYIQSTPHNGNKHDLHKETVFGDRELVYEARRLKEFQRYEFWVTASTSVGEGPASSKVPQSPISRVPARIASFSQHVVAGAEKSVILQCHAVGLPAPTRQWRNPLGTNITSNNVNRPHKILPDGSLVLGPLKPDDAGNYTCLAENVFGKDEVSYSVVVQVPPSQPLLSVPATTMRSIALQWKVNDDGGSPIIGYTLNYKREFEEWQELSIDPDRKTYTLDSVKCGSVYQLFISAHNAVGTSKSSNIITASTKGSAPRVPLQDDLLVVNSTSVTLFLDAWPSGGCPLQYFVVEYRARSQNSWTLVSNNIKQEELVIPDLTPGTWYALKVAANNDAGSSSQEYVFATKTRGGETLLSEMVPDSSEQQGSFYTHLNVIIPIVSGVICTIAASICVCIIIHRRNYAGYKQGDSGYSAKSLAELENQRNNDQQGSQSGQLYSPSPARKGDSSLSVQKGSDTSGQDYEICPYATFSLPGTGNNTQTMDYSMQFQTFSQQECYAGQPRPSTSGYGSKSTKDYYSRVRSKSNGSRNSTELKISRCSKSPPDGLSLEISCISSQQTLPVSVAANSGHRRNKSPPNQNHRESHSSSSGIGFGHSRSCSVGADRERSDSDSSTGVASPRRRESKSHSSQYRLPAANNRSNKISHHGESAFELDSSTESTEASPEVSHRHRRAAGASGAAGAARGGGGRPAPSRHRHHHHHHHHSKGATRGGGSASGAGAAGAACQEAVPLQPPTGFSDAHELSEAECDREANGSANTGLPLFRHEELEQELSTLVKRYRQERDREKQDYTIHV